MEKNVGKLSKIGIAVGMASVIGLSGVTSASAEVVTKTVSDEETAQVKKVEKQKKFKDVIQYSVGTRGSDGDSLLHIGYNSTKYETFYLNKDDNLLYEDESHTRLANSGMDLPNSTKTTKYKVKNGKIYKTVKNKTTLYTGGMSITPKDKYAMAYNFDENSDLYYKYYLSVKNGKLNYMNVTRVKVFLNKYISKISINKKNIDKKPVDGLRVRVLGIDTNGNEQELEVSRDTVSGLGKITEAYYNAHLINGTYKIGKSSTKYTIKDGVIYKGSKLYSGKITLNYSNKKTLFQITGSMVVKNGIVTEYKGTTVDYKGLHDGISYLMYSV